MLACEGLRRAGRQHPKQIACTRRDRKQQEEPLGSQIADSRETAEQLVLDNAFAAELTAHESSTPQQRALAGQRAKTTRLSKPGPHRPAGGVQGRWARHRPHSRRGSCPSAPRDRHDVRVVQEGEDCLTFSESGSGLAQSRIARESRALASAGRPVLLLRLAPHHFRRRCRRARCKSWRCRKTGGRTGGVGQGPGGPEPFQHGLARYMVVGADRIDGQHGRVWVQLGSSVGELVQALSACPRAQPKLVRKARFLESTGEELGQRTGDQAPENVANDECPTSPGLARAPRRRPLDQRPSRAARSGRVEHRR